MTDALKVRSYVIPGAAFIQESTNSAWVHIKKVSYINYSSVQYDPTIRACFMKGHIMRSKSPSRGSDEELFHSSDTTKI